ncbi:MAG TPA: UrcA family protein [Steroidobacteraceae bacterium]|nr:UrcA family protein [Steroidobacteraceae bacterium]
MSTINTFSTAKTQTAVALGAVAALLLGFALIPIANAETADATPTRVVRYDAQSLETDSGARAIYEKIAAAAREVCSENFSHDLRAFHEASQCRKAAIARAVEQIHHPRLVEIASHRANRG